MLHSHSHGLRQRSSTLLLCKLELPQACKNVDRAHLMCRPVLITPPPIPTGLWESSRIPTGFLLDSNKIPKKAFSHIFSFPPTGLLLDSYWIPTGLQLNLNKCHKLNPIVQILDSYWSITITVLIYLTNLITLHSPSILKKSVIFEYS